MRIGIEAQRLFRHQKHGIDIVALELIHALQEIDGENEYFIFVKPDKDNKILNEKNNFNIVEVDGPIYPVWEQISLPAEIKKFNLDILHCTANTAPLKLNIPMVLTLHDIIFLEKIYFTKGTWYQRIGNLYRRWLAPQIVRRSSLIGTVSEFERKNIIDYFSLDHKKIYTVYNGVGNHFRLIRDNNILNEFKNKYNLPDDYILSFYSEDPRKNAINIIRAYAKLIKQGKTIPMFMPGISTEVINYFTKHFNIPEIQGNIIPGEYIPNHQLPMTYNLARLFIFPSTRESFGIPVIESMACGTPVITSNTSSLPEVSGNSAVLVDPNHPDSICNAMIELLDDRKKYEEYVQKGLDRSKDFRWIDTAKKWLDIYKEVIH